MANTSLKRINSFIEMYDMQDVLIVRECGTGPYPKHEPADRYVDGQVVTKGYQVSHKVGDDDYYIYVCKTLTATAECVNQIIFELPMENNISPAE
jgi:hypothetical protein